MIDPPLRISQPDEAPGRPNPPETGERDEPTLCPKRGWVMSVLSDDEFDVSSTPLPRGLQFHVSRCPSCRELADRLLDAGERLARLSGGEPSDSLQDRADAAVLAALDEGCRPKIELDASDLLDELLIDRETMSRDPWPTRARLLKIAALIVFACLVGYAVYVERTPPPPSDHWTSRNDSTPSKVEEPSRPNDLPDPENYVQAPESSDPQAPLPSDETERLLDQMLGNESGGFQRAWSSPRKMGHAYSSPSEP